MRSKRLSIIAAAAIGLAASCTDNGTDRLTIAESELEAGRHESAQSLSDQMLNDGTIDTAGVVTLCRLSLLSAKLAELSDQDVNIANATRCMQAALRRDSDSVTIFIENLPIEDRSRSELVSQLMRAINHPADSLLITDMHEHDEAEIDNNANE